MPSPRSRKQERELLARSLRAQCKSWTEIAEVFRVRFRVNARVAFRFAHGWSQQQAADEWCRLWPDDVKTLKNFSYWELWPGTTGHAPSFDTLGKLAQIYECSVADLLADLPDYRYIDDAHKASFVASDPPETPKGEVVLFDQAETVLLDLLRSPDAQGPVLSPPSGNSSALSSLGWQLQEVTYGELAQVIVMWLQQLNPILSRRELLAKLSAAVTVAAASPLFDMADPRERERVAGALHDAWRFDQATLQHCQSMVGHLRRQGDVLGAQLTLQSALAHRQTMRRLAQGAPTAHASQVLSVYAELTQLVGWLCFNLGDYRSAQHYYDDARTAAHDAHNVELVTYVLCTMSQLATWQGKPRVGLDHAAAASVWAIKTGNPRAEAYAADVAARALAADSQNAACLSTLDAEYAALARFDSGEPGLPLWYFYDESFYWATASGCSLKLGDADGALEAAERSLAILDPANLHNYAFTKLFKCEAFIRHGNVEQASQTLADVAVLAAVNTSQRIDKNIADMRSALTPWQRTKPIRELDEVLAAYRRSPSDSGRT